MSACERESVRVCVHMCESVSVCKCESVCAHVCESVRVCVRSVSLRINIVIHHDPLRQVRPGGCEMKFAEREEIKHINNQSAINEDLRRLLMCVCVHNI